MITEAGEELSWMTVAGKHDNILSSHIPITMNEDFGKNNVNAGPLKDLPEICVDHFLGDDLKSTAFFLSHAHTDHMAGLESQKFLQRLSEPGIKLYCHLITPILLEDFGNYLGGEKQIRELIGIRKIIPMNPNEPTPIVVSSSRGDYSVTVTLLPAGHCPGSVMFLFETESTRILHTGDCRLSVKDLKSMRPLYMDDLQKEKKRIDQLYIDTTFCSASANVFPNRKVAFDKSIEHVRKWKSQGSDKYVRLQFAGRFAHEYILSELHKAFNLKVHVADKKHFIYDQIPGIRKAVTKDPRTPFHLCWAKNDCINQKDYLTVKFSSMWFTKLDEENRTPIVMRGRTLSVCYAMHSSLDEITNMIDHLQPNIVTPLVNPLGSSMMDVYDALTKSCKWKFNYNDHKSCIQIPITTNATTSQVPPPPSLQRMSSSECEEDEFLSPKKPKLPPSVDSAKWNFQSSPSLSQSSGSSRDNSQELAFQMPQPMDIPLHAVAENSECLIDGIHGDDGSSP